MRAFVLPTLLAVSACAGSGSNDPLLIEVAGPSGLTFTHSSGATGRFYLPEITGSGVGLVDYDNDGDLDVLFAQGAPLGADSPPPAMPGNRLFRSELIPSGRLVFTDVSSQVGDLGGGFAIGIAAGDIDNDADIDVLITGVSGNALLRNDGGRFVDVTDEAGVGDGRWNASASFSDYDLDGDLDLFITAYVGGAISANRPCRNGAGQPDYCSPGNFEPLPDRLYANDGAGRFTDVSEAAGIAASAGNGLGVVAADFNGDGAPDFYVANDQTGNHLWLNRGDGSFDETALMAGAAYNANGRAEASMGVTSGDFDADGDEDLFMTHLNGETNTLFRNEGDASFVDLTDRANLGSGSLQYTGWGAKWIDFDNDSDLDLFVANGAVMLDAAHADIPYGQRNQLWLNRDGRFESLADVSLEPANNSRGTAFGDIDNDGDIDFVVSNNNGPASLYLNQTNGARHWLSVRLAGRQNNLEGIGARIAVMVPGQPTRWQRVGRDGSFASANDVRAHFGLGAATKADVGIVWPNGLREVHRSLPADRVVSLTEGEGEPWR